MIRHILGAAHRLDTWLADKFGQPYRALLGIGLAAEIVQHIREFPERFSHSGSMVRELLALLLFLALLLHQLSEFREHMAARRLR